MARPRPALDAATAPLEVYEVGGAVRDALLGRPVHDRDWVVVGASPERMIALGFKPVGRDFPVFLHPKTGEEYALARTERKTGPGYRGFEVHYAPDVTLTDDLRRRDLTINAMARAADGTVIDPWGGQADLRDGYLRHVSPAFAEDPVRILRVARLAARLPNFAIAPETLSLMTRMVDAGEVDALVAERVWQELARGLLEAHPSRMIAVLQHCHALAHLIPDLAPHWNPPTAQALDHAATHHASLPVRVAILLHALTPTAATRTCQRLKAPNECQALVTLVGRAGSALSQAAHLAPAELLSVLEQCDALRQPERFQALLDVNAWCSPAIAPPSDDTVWHRALAAARAVRAGLIAADIAPQSPPSQRAQSIQAAVQAARVQAITSALASQSAPSHPGGS